MTHGEREALIGDQDESMVISIDRDWPFSKALKFMVDNNLHSVAVVNAGTDSLVATLSLSDLRKIKLNQITDDLTVEKLLAIARNVNKLSDCPPEITCYPSSTLRETMEKVIQNHIHRVWIVDFKNGDPNTLKDVVSLTNIIQGILDE